MNPTARLTYLLGVCLLALPCAASPIPARAQARPGADAPAAEHGPSHSPEGISPEGWQSILGQIAAADFPTVVVGAYQDDDAGSDSGSAYIFNIAGCEWNEFAEPVAEDPAAGDEFGTSVSISGDTAIVGAWLADDVGPASGAVYVFERHAGGADGWSQVRQLTAVDTMADDRFGFSVSIDGDTVVVGAFQQDEAGWESGAAYVFERNAGGADNWGKVKKLIASDAMDNDEFGFSVSISGDTVVVGNMDYNWATSGPGAAYVFERNAGGSDNWGQVKKLTAADAMLGDLFGRPVSIQGDTIVAGAPGNNEAGSDSGAAYVFDRNAGGADCWGQVKKLIATDAAWGDGFGISVSISSDIVAVGALREDHAGKSSGAAYLFERNAGGADQWGQLWKLAAADASEEDWFGTSISISGDTVAVGAHGNDDAGSSSGSAYVFERNAGGPDNWGQVGKLTAADAAAGDEFGGSVSISGDTIVAGAPESDDAGLSSGSVYIYAFNCPVCGDGLQEIPEACDDGNTVGGDDCSADCRVAATGVPGEASPEGDLRASRAGSGITVAYTPACASTDHAAYWGLGPIPGAVNWIDSACELGTTGAASFDPGVVLLPDEWLYFVLVGYDGEDEGDNGGRSEAVGVGVCDRPTGPSTCESIGKTPSRASPPRRPFSTSRRTERR